MSNGFLLGFRGYAVHYAGHINILHKGTRTLINHPTRGGTPVCGTTSPRASYVLERKEVTCKRCLSLIAKHDQTAALQRQGKGEEVKR
jgi:hypothetical protein